MKTRDVMFWIFMVCQFFLIGELFNKLNFYQSASDFIIVLILIISIIGVEYLIYTKN